MVNEFFHGRIKGSTRQLYLLVSLCMVDIWWVVSVPPTRTRIIFRDWEPLVWYTIRPQYLWIHPLTWALMIWPSQSSWLSPTMPKAAAKLVGISDRSGTQLVIFQVHGACFSHQTCHSDSWMPIICDYISYGHSSVLLICIHMIGWYQHYRLSGYCTIDACLSSHSVAGFHTFVFEPQPLVTILRESLRAEVINPNIDCFPTIKVHFLVPPFLRYDIPTSLVDRYTSCWLVHRWLDLYIGYVARVHISLVPAHCECHHQDWVKVPAMAGCGLWIPVGHQVLTIRLFLEI